MLEKITLTIPEVAEILGINRLAAYALAQRDDFPAVRITQRRIIVPTDAFYRWLNEQSAGTSKNVR